MTDSWFRRLEWLRVKSVRVEELKGNPYSLRVVIANDPASLRAGE